LSEGEYDPIRPREGRLASRVTGLHLEADGTDLRLWNPQAERWLLTWRERQERAQRLDSEFSRLQQQLEPTRRQDGEQ
jgi:hypothetical protein